MLRLQPSELSFGHVELNKTYTKLLTLINEQKTPLDFAIRPSNRERYTVYPSSINLPANSSTTVQVQLRVEKFANRKKAETKGQRDSFKITSRYFEQKVWSTWWLQSAHRSDSAPSANENSTEAVEFPSDHHRRHLNDRLDLFNRFAVKVDGSHKGNLDQASATSFDNSHVGDSERAGSTSLRTEQGRTTNTAESIQINNTASVAIEPTPLNDVNAASEASKSPHNIDAASHTQLESQHEGVRQRVHNDAGSDIRHSRSNNISVLKSTREGAESTGSVQEQGNSRRQRRMPPANQHRQNDDSLQRAQHEDDFSSLHNQSHRQDAAQRASLSRPVNSPNLQARNAEVQQLRAQLSILEGRFAGRESELADCRQQMVRH